MFQALMSDLTLPPRRCRDDRQGYSRLQRFGRRFTQTEDFVALSKAGSDVAKTASAELFLADRTAATSGQP